MKNRVIWFSLCIVAAFTPSCNEDPIIEPEIPAWKKFEGTYNVTKLENGQTYQMEIAFDSLVHQPSGETHLYTIYRNFDNSFDSLSGFYIDSSDPNRIRNFDIQHGIEDYDDSRWSLNMLSNDPDTPEQENTLVNDTILFCFRKINVAFYVEDGVPFYECECKHLAVKID